jgi:LacI family transcriptional regulator
MTNSDDNRDGGSRKAARLIDVALRAEVSRATAARVLGGYSAVSETTREKVLAAAKELNYVVNDLARSMRSGKTLTIGVVVADIANSFFNSSIQAIIETAGAAGYQILVLHTGDDIKRERAAVQVLLEKRVDGLIVVPSSRAKTDHLHAVGSNSIPVVLLDRRIDPVPLDSVTTDDYTSAKSAIELFIRRGHRRIGMLLATVAVDGYGVDQPKDAVSTVIERTNGGRAALDGAGIAMNRNWILYSRSELPIATEAALRMLARDDRPTAVLATNEEMALACISACEQLDLTVGGDVSLIGFDDAPWASVFRPALSVIRRPTYELGRQAVTILIDRIKGEKSAGSVKLPAVLIDRQSVATLF